MGEEKQIEQFEVEGALQNELEKIQSEVEAPYSEIVTTVVQRVLDDAGLADAWVSEVSVAPPDYIVPSQNSRCFMVYVPRVGHVKICVPLNE